MKTDIPYGALEECRFPLVPLGAIAHFTSGWTPSSKNSAFYSGVNKWATIADLNSHYISDTRQRISDVAVREAGHPKLSNPGDLLFSFKLSVGMTSIVSSPMYTNEAIATFRPSRYLDAGFAYYAFPVFLSAAARPNIYGAPLLSASLISRARVPRLSLMHQRRIADYLDEEVREMDALIADLNLLVSDLTARQTLVVDDYIQGAEGAQLLRLPFFGEAITGITYSPQDVVDSDGLAVYRSGNVQASKVDRSDMLYVDLDVPDKYRFRSGDILMCSRNGSAKLVGKNALVESRDIGATWGAFMTVIRSPLNDYLYWFYRSSRFRELQGEFATSTINQLTIGFLNTMVIPVPQPRERERIVRALTRETAEMDFLIKEATELIENLKARKTALITEVVTGRKKV